jgi:hypothetical protein
MNIEINLTEKQIVQIVAQDIKHSYAVNKKLHGNKIDEADINALRAALKLVYHFYTGKNLK